MLGFLAGVVVGALVTYLYLIKKWAEDFDRERKSG